MQQAVVTPHPTAAPRARRTRTHGVFPAFAAVLMLCVVAGFGRTFFFRAWFEAPPLSSAQAVHGVVVTGWFAVFLVQALLVRHDRVALHRRLGLLGVRSRWPRWSRWRCWARWMRSARAVMTSRPCAASCRWWSGEISVRWPHTRRSSCAGSCCVAVPTCTRG